MLDFAYPNMLDSQPPGDSDDSRRLPQPGELWSFWDLMKWLSITPLVDIGDEIVRVRGLYFLDESFVGKLGQNQTLVPKFAQRLKEVLGQMADACEHFDAPEMAKFLKDHATDDDLLPTEWAVYDTLCKGFWDGIHGKSIFVLSRASMDLYRERKTPFGAVVSRAFKAIDAELERATECLAFGFSTACVFHLMRVMEKAVRQMGTHLGATIPDDADWGTVLSKMDERIDLMPKGAERTRWSEARKNLWHVKEAVRNEVMHPRKEGYIQDEAEANFRAVKTFMQHMASLMLPPPAPAPTAATILPGAKPVPKSGG